MVHVEMQGGHDGDVKSLLDPGTVTRAGIQSPAVGIQSRAEKSRSWDLLIGHMGARITPMLTVIGVRRPDRRE